MKVIGEQGEELLRALNVRGKIGDFVVRQCGDKIVIAARPRKSKKKLTEHQQKTKNRFNEAVEYAKGVMRDPALMEKYSDLKKGQSVYSAALTDFLRNM